MTKIQQFFRGWKKGAKEFSYSIGTSINLFLLLVVYITGIGLTAIVAKLSNKRFLECSKEKEESYWSELNTRKTPIENYYRQF